MSASSSTISSSAASASSTTPPSPSTLQPAPYSHATQAEGPPESPKSIQAGASSQSALSAISSTSPGAFPGSMAFQLLTSPGHSATLRLETGIIHRRLPHLGLWARAEGPMTRSTHSSAMPRRIKYGQAVVSRRPGVELLSSILIRIFGPRLPALVFLGRVRRLPPSRRIALIRVCYLPAHF
jgi:hypothetical protein